MALLKKSERGKRKSIECRESGKRNAPSRNGTRLWKSKNSSTRIQSIFVFPFPSRDPLLGRKRLFRCLVLNFRSSKATGSDGTTIADRDRIQDRETTDSKAEAGSTKNQGTKIQSKVNSNLCLCGRKYIQQVEYWKLKT